MRSKFIWAFIFALLISPCGMSYAGEHGGKEHGGKEHEGKEHGGAASHEHGGKTAKKPAASDIRSAMKAYVKEKSAETGSFEVYDDKIGRARRLKLLRIHKRVGKTGDYYYSCADFKDLDSGEKIDVDLDVQDKDGQLNVVDVRIHKVDAKERYTYDKNDNRIMVNE